MEIGVVGAGIIGSWTALHLREAGVTTTLIDRSALPPAGGSSQGRSRAFRFLGDDTLDRLEYSLDRWLALERQFGERLFVRTGLLNFGPNGDAFLERYMAVVLDGGRPCDWVSHAEIAERFPTLRYPREWGAAWDPNGGILLADRCLEAVQRRFRELGGRVATARVTSLEPTADGRVRIDSTSPDGEAVRSSYDAVAVCTGPWAAGLLPELDRVLRIVSTPVTYWRDPTGEHAAARGFPILFNARLTDVYGLPSYEYPGRVKVLFHGGPASDPESSDPAAFDPYVRRVADYVRRHLPLLDASGPAILETCFYAMTPDGRPIIDRLHDGVIVGAGFSGSGFKHAPATGRMVAALVMGRASEVPGGFALGRYSVERLSRSTRPRLRTPPAD